VALSPPLRIEIAVSRSTQSTVLPSISSRRAIVFTSRTVETLRSTTVWSVSSEAAMAGSRAFLAPETVTVPFSFFPPLISSLSMDALSLQL